MSIRVVVAEDNALLRDGLVRLIRSTKDLSLVGAGGTYDELIDLVAETTPDVVVTDIGARGTSSLAGHADGSDTTAGAVRG